MRIVDLSQDIYEGMKVYPGHLKTVQFEHATHEEAAAVRGRLLTSRTTRTSPTWTRW